MKEFKYKIVYNKTLAFYKKMFINHKNNSKEYFNSTSRLNINWKYMKSL